MTHIPGPWKLGWGYADYLAIEAYYPEDKAWWPIAIIELDEHGAKPTTEQEANARLIAAAPELLEALKAIEIMGRNANSRNDRAQHMGNVARKAIAKAEGKDA